MSSMIVLDVEVLTPLTDIALFKHYFKSTSFS